MVLVIIPTKKCHGHLKNSADQQTPQVPAVPAVSGLR